MINGENTMQRQKIKKESYEFAVIGGGNSAAADALLLSRICEKVIVIHRRDTLRATKIYHAPLMEAERVSFLWNTAPVELLKDKRLTGLRLKDSFGSCVKWG